MSSRPKKGARTGFAVQRSAVDPFYFQSKEFYKVKKKQVADPSSLIVVDETDQLQMNSLEQIRSISTGATLF